MLKAPLLLALALLPCFAQAQERWLVSWKPSVWPEHPTLLAKARAARGGSSLALLESGAERAARPLANELRRHGGRVTRAFWIAPVAEVEASAQAIDALRASPLVDRIDPVEVRAPHVFVATNAANHNADWVQSSLQLYGSFVGLGLVDSGIDRYCANHSNQPHPAFDSPIGSRIVKYFDAVASRNDPEDRDGHGTAVAAIALGKDFGVTGPFRSDDGFAPLGDLYSYRITIDAQGNTNDTTLLVAWTRLASDAFTNGQPRVAVNSFAGSPLPQHPVQRAIDNTSVFGDVLIVTSAGNGALLGNPTSSSQSNCNGLAVGAVLATSHVLWDQSSYGPLKGDPARYFPDLVAVGKDVYSAKLDDKSITTRCEGTSFAAPMVAGTALVVRGAQPGFSFLDTKAVLLNYTEDLSAQNPERTRQHLGLGMLRTDLAVDGALHGQMFRDTVVLDQKETFRFPIKVRPDQSFAATLTWARNYDAIAASGWANLDLRVFDANGRLLAVSDSPRNLYEKVLFAVTENQICTLEVRTVETPFAEVPFSLAFGINRGGGRQPGTYRLTGAGCVGSGADPAAGVIQPPGASGQYQSGRSRLPYWSDSGTARVMHALHGGAFGPGPITIERIAWRRDDEQADTIAFEVELEVFLGETTRAVNALNTSFLANWNGPPPPPAFSKKKVMLPGTQGLPYDPNRFDWVLPLDTPVTLNLMPPKNALLEVRCTSTTLGLASPPVWLDATQDFSGYDRLISTASPSSGGWSYGTIDQIANVLSFMRPGLPGTFPDLQAVRTPQLADVFDVVLRHARPGAACALAHSCCALAPTVNLTPFGAPGCILRADTSLALGQNANSVGQSVWTYALPNLPELTGTTFWNQIVVLDAAANGLGLVLTNAGQATIGG